MQVKGSYETQRRNESEAPTCSRGEVRSCRDSHRLVPASGKER